MSGELRVAIIGARGIGKFHANWHTLAGAEVVTFAGTSPETCERTAESLKKMIGFSGRGYWDVDEMLEKEKSQIVDVCSPPEFHKEHSLKALNSGAHVLCEKPFVWDDLKSYEDLISDAEEITNTAREKGLILGVCTQYVAAKPCYMEVYREIRGEPGGVESFFMHIESKERGRDRSPGEIWTDLAAHPLSLLMELVPGGRIDPKTISVSVSDKEVKTTFDFVSPSGERCETEIVTAGVEENPIKRFGINGLVVDNVGKPGKDGVYKSIIIYEGREWRFRDFMHTTVAHFDAVVRTGEGRPLTTGDEAIENLRAQIEIMRFIQSIKKA